MAIAANLPDRFFRQGFVALDAAKCDNSFSLGPPAWSPRPCFPSSPASAVHPSIAGHVSSPRGGPMMVWERVGPFSGSRIEVRMGRMWLDTRIHLTLGNRLVSPVRRGTYAADFPSGANATPSRNTL